MPGAFQIQVEADVFVGGVSLRAGVADARSGDGQLELLDKNMVWSGAAQHRYELHGNAVHWLSGLGDEGDEGIVWDRCGQAIRRRGGDTSISENPSASRWVRNPASTACGVWSGTRRKSTLAEARAGSTVFEPGPW